MLRKIHIPTKHLVPFILAGFNALSMLVLALVWNVSARNGSPRTYGLVILVFSLVSLGGSYLLVRWIIGPLERFIKKVRQNPAIPSDLFEAQADSATSDVRHYEYILQRITDLIDKTEASRLFPDILGQSRLMRGLMRRILDVAPSDATVLITGESGTGKELVASAVLAHSRRADQPLIKVNCAAIPEGLLENELFGHDKGAFTGAVSALAGKFELADKGTVFLDEIADMPLSVQAKLLRVLQEKEIQRLGGSKTIRVDLRVIAATNKDLEALVADGRFREDLFFRINVFRLDIPPLRARREDIPILAASFAAAAPTPKKLAPETLDALASYDWPGNVRELRNVIESACITTRQDTIDPRQLALPSLSNAASPFEPAPAMDASPVDDLDRWLAEAEKKIIIATLRQCNGIQSRAARQLNIKERSLWHRVKKYRIDPKACKSGE
jgi:transcriptional regulator with GAF, ATPase, and Fis domain